ncbi:radical SAM family heme chaperone HemW [Pleomorphovibrio marinus]|uniref:radical SAM family heme chaperone HemW n=1 Tax=Pleomorphovibrio marinus TaxID=2164132 RepID=UPI000E0A1289|nr:radical SAM family heme chaperone HemW [Pleomorphovibrio marinus]
MAGIYIHIPFCKQACHYCDFHFSTSLDLKTKLIDMLNKELITRREYLGRAGIVRTIYFGGGTPSLLTPLELGRIMDTITEQYQLDLQEITLEANPDDLNPMLLAAYKSIGINRLSLGIQSFHDEVLRFYNRAHDQSQSLRIIEMAKEAGFEKLSIDLIYGYPYPNHKLWKKDLEIALSKNPGHISSYALTLEPKTVLENWAKKGVFSPASEDFVAEQYEWLLDQTEAEGYLAYEISNFARPTELALHNSNYWKGVPYLGIGPSAHSFDGQHRGHNIPNNPKYIKEMQKRGTAHTPEILSAEESANDYILTSLRTIWGLDRDIFYDKTGRDIYQEKIKELDWLSQNQWITIKDKNIYLSRKGKLLADDIASRLFF